MLIAEKLFYTINDFDFKESYRNGDISTYLVAITEPRRKAIRHMRLPISWHMSAANAGQLYTLVTACHGLQSLHLQYSWRFFAGSGPFFPSSVPGFRECLIAVQGLKQLSVGVEDIPKHYGPSWGTDEQRKSFGKQFEALLLERLPKPRSKT